MMKVILENKFINDTVSIHKIVCRNKICVIRMCHDRNKKRSCYNFNL